MRKSIAALSLATLVLAVTAGSLLAGKGEGKKDGAVKGDSAVKAKAEAKGETKAKGEHKCKDTTVELELTGFVMSKEHTKENKEGKTCTSTVFYLTNADGDQVALPQACGAKNKDGSDNPAANLQLFVDKEVKVKARGWVKEDKEGNKKTAVAHIVSIENRSVR